MHANWALSIRIGGVTIRTRTMTRIWTTALASFLLIGFAAVVSAAAIAVAQEPDARIDGKAMMVESEYRLALQMRR